jgi:protein involved in polysaccharide export with SLBB domain
VAGLTTSQIKDAIGKRLGELKLGTADRVTVTAKRVGK